MRKNRFEEVDEVQEDAITLELAPGGDAETARVHVPAACSGGRLDADTSSEPMPKVDAFRSAVKLANELKAPIVVLDPAKAWVADWGDLYRPV
jgi:hypothetical protein